MSNDSLRDLLASGYDTHASSLGSGEAFAQRYGDRVAGKVRRRRVVRHASVAGTTAAILGVIAVSAYAVVDNSRNAIPFASPTISPSPSASPSPSVSSSDDSGVGSYVLDPLPTGPARGVITENDVLRLVTNATPPSTPGAPSGVVACGDPVTGTYVDPLFDEATARILKPDTVFPTFLDPSYEIKPTSTFLHDVRGNGGWFIGADGQIDRSYSELVGRFFVSVSFTSTPIEQAYFIDPETGFERGGLAVIDWTTVARQGDISVSVSDLSVNTDDIDLAFGAVLVQDGVIVGHALLWNEETDTDGRSVAVDPATTLWGINEVHFSDGTTQGVYDLGVGPLEYVAWCGAQPSGPVDAYAVIGSRSFEQQDLDYSFIWAGQVEYN